MTRLLLGGLVFAAMAMLPGRALHRTPDAEPPLTEPAYTQTGELTRPVRHREWIFVGASLGLSYAPEQQASGHGQFHHVYLQPAAYRAFVATGSFPPGTMLALEIYEPGEKTPPALQGLFEDRRVALEIAVKDPSRFPEAWAYFGFGDGSRATGTKAGPGCVACHRKHAAIDHVFTQFYPVLREARR
jgi:Cytochrome P460